MPSIGVSQEFQLTADHVKLLGRAVVRWGEMEWGAPEIDGKRPYGNGDLHHDVCEILGWVEDWDDITPRRERELFKAADVIHRETETALAVCLAAGTFRPGLYVTDGAYDRNWKRA